MTQWLKWPLTYWSVVYRASSRHHGSCSGHLCGQRAGQAGAAFLLLSVDSWPCWSSSLVHETDGRQAKVWKQEGEGSGARSSGRGDWEGDHWRLHSEPWIQQWLPLMVVCVVGWCFLFCFVVVGLFVCLFVCLFVVCCCYLLFCFVSLLLLMCGWVGGCALACVCMGGM